MENTTPKPKRRLNTHPTIIVSLCDDGEPVVYVNPAGLDILKRIRFEVVGQDSYGERELVDWSLLGFSDMPKRVRDLLLGEDS